MSLLTRWLARLGATAAALLTVFLLPAVAWAQSSSTLDLAGELARRRPRGGIGFAGVLGTLCCLVVVAAIVLALVMVARRRRSR